MKFYKVENAWYASFKQKLPRNWNRHSGKQMYRCRYPNRSEKQLGTAIHGLIWNNIMWKGFRNCSKNTLDSEIPLLHWMASWLVGSDFVNSFSLKQSQLCQFQSHGSHGSWILNVFLKLALLRCVDSIIVFLWYIILHKLKFTNRYESFSSI